MIETKGYQYAYPLVYDTAIKTLSGEGGLTKLEYFSSLFMQAFLSERGSSYLNTADFCMKASKAVDCAEVLISEINKIKELEEKQKQEEKQGE